VSQSSSASDLITLSLASLQAGAPGAATNWILRADRNLAIVRPSLRPDCSGLCAGCFLDLCRPHTRRRGLATGSLRRCLCGWFAAFVLRRRTRKSLSPSPTPDVGTSALLAGASSLYKQHTALTLVAALLAGLLLGGEN
jgi:hypothetical protein